MVAHSPGKCETRVRVPAEQCIEKFEVPYGLAGEVLSRDIEVCTEGWKVNVIGPDKLPHATTRERKSALHLPTIQKSLLVYTTAPTGSVMIGFRLVRARQLKPVYGLLSRLVSAALMQRTLRFLSQCPHVPRTLERKSVILQKPSVKPQRGITKAPGIVRVCCNVTVLTWHYGVWVRGL
ncbi:hypothetical protein J6590_040806 [Homalodisca vitripennis]|nr:hypothetical protein J6590_040806 [Homalodisca vitripennis]